MMKRVLVVDDDRDMAELLGHMLQLNGYEPAVFVTAESALQEAQTHPPDAVVLDIMMEDVDGWTLCERLRAITRAPILFVTAWRTGENAERAKSLGAHFLTKPLSHQELAQELRKIIG